MSGGGKGGQQQATTTLELPKNITKAAEKNLKLANQIGKIGYVPYRGNTVAAFTPAQRAAMSNTNAAASAFNMGTAGASPTTEGVAVDPFTGMAMDPTLSGGVLGYSPAGIYDDAKAMIPAGQRRYIDSFFIDPHTGRMPGSAAGGAPARRTATGYSSSGIPAFDAARSTFDARAAGMGSGGFRHRPRGGFGK